MTRPAEAAAPPRWIPVWLAALPVVYVVSPLALLALPHLARLPRAAWWVLGFYALSQQLPALFAPEPLLASVLALARTALMFGLIGVGVALRDARRLRPLALGLGVVYVTALIYSALGGADIFVSRLTHPYMTSITLGLAGAFGVWLALFGGGRLLWRVPLGLFALGVLLLSGSRGPLAAALAGCAAGFLMRRGRRLILALLVGAGLLAGGVLLGERLGVGAVTRLGSADTTGRDVIWSNTLTVIQAHPWSGVGSYRLGSFLTPPGQGCTLFPDAQGAAAACPAWLSALGNPWLIAHNLVLQQLAETGPLGLAGLGVLLTAVVGSTLARRQPLSAAVVSGLLLATVTDNTLLLPSPFFAEVFWVVAGWQLAHLSSPTALTGGLGAGLLLILGAPLSAQALPASQPPPQAGEFRLAFFNAAERVTDPRAYRVFVKFDLPPGSYRVSLNTCTRSCVTVATRSFLSTADGSPLLSLEGDLEPQPRQRLELRLSPGRSSLRLRPLAQRSWTVERVP